MTRRSWYTLSLTLLLALGLTSPAFASAPEAEQLSWLDKARDGIKKGLDKGKEGVDKGAEGGKKGVVKGKEGAKKGADKIKEGVDKID